MMKKVFAALMIAVTVLGGAFPAVQPVPSKAAPADAPAPPTPTPPESPVKPISGAEREIQSRPTPPDPGELAPEMEKERARDAIKAVLQKRLDYWGPRYQIGAFEVEVEGEWAHGVAEWQDAAKPMDGPIHLLARRDESGTWQALMPSEEGMFPQWVESVPERLVSDNKKSQLLTRSTNRYNRQYVVDYPKIITSTTPVYYPLTPDEHFLIPFTPLSKLKSQPEPRTWVADETSVSQLSEKERTNLCGVSEETIEWEYRQAEQRTTEPNIIHSYPSSVDWRNFEGHDYTTPIRDQGTCGSCVAFATIGAIEARMEVADGDPNLNPDLSEAHLFFCNDRQCNVGDPRYGWSPEGAMNYARDTGIVDEPCFPYTDYNQNCNLCADWQNKITEVDDWTGTSSVSEMKQALADYGPLEVTMAVYDDFYSYSGGVYRHDQGNFSGYHAVTLVGYNDNQDYWIAKNSWGTDWGESGWFRIAYGECDIDNYAYIPDLGYSPPPPPPEDSWKVDYYNDVNMNVHVGTDYEDSTFIDHNWGDGGPGYGVGDDTFSIRYERDVYFDQTGEWQFHVKTDGGFKLYVDGQEIGGEWWSGSHDIGPRTDLSTGEHTVRLDYFEESGTAYVELWWEYKPTPDPPVANFDAWPQNGQAPLSVRFHNTSSGDYDSCSWDYGDGSTGTSCSDYHNHTYDSAGTYTVQLTVSGPGGADTKTRTGYITVDSAPVVGPIVYDSRTVDDDNSDNSSGNNDSIVNCGETIELYIDLRNQGDSTASGVNATISTSDSYVNFTHNIESSYPDIYGGSIDDNDNDFDFEVASDTPNGHSIHFEMNVTASNGGPWTTSFDVPVTCINNSPNLPASPSPTDGAINQGLNVDLSWTGGDPDGDAVIYDVYFGTSSNPPLVSSDQTDTTYDPGTLSYDTHYYWKIVAEDENGETTTGPVWDFTTEAEPVVGPLVYNSHTIDDDSDGQSNGNNDGVVNCGEAVELYADLYNEGNTTATGINTTISTTDAYITFTYNTDSAYPDIAGGSSGTNSGDFDFEVDPDTPDGHVIQFDLGITAGNGGPWSDGFDVVVACPKPDLAPSQWRDWQYPIVPSSVTDTNVVNTLYAGYVTYIDWGLSNQGDINTGGNTYGDLYIDDERVGHYDFGDVLAGQNWAFFDWWEVIDTPGWHTLESVVDPDGLIKESDETNNTWGRQFYWIPTAPYSDDLENGSDDWTATGLWHLTDAWQVDFYNDTSLTYHTNQTFKPGQFINDDWGYYDGPGYGVSADEFSARYQRYVYFDRSGDWVFRAQADDGVRLYVDGQKVMDEWWDSCCHDITATVTLATGYHLVELEYYENTRGSYVSVWWDEPQTQTATPNTPSPAHASDANAHSWWYGQENTGSYDTGAATSGELTSPPVYIPDSGYYLRFWYWYETETQSPYWDQRKVQISVDDGPFYDVLQLYDDPMNYWLQSPAIDLSSYAGHTIQVRFYFNTFDAQYNSYQGWYIDDFEISDTPPPTCGDTHEPNGSPAEATSISYGQSVDADICAGGDYDFYQFTGGQGDKIAVDIDAMSEGSSLDPYAYLLRDDGSTVLAQNDDEITAEVRDSLLGYQLPYTGTYYIKVKAWDHPSAGSSDHFYTLKLLTDDANPSSAEVTTPSTDSWLDPETVTVTVSAVDDESGVHRVEFLWHDADWENAEWVWLGADYDGRDGWTLPFDTSTEIEQRGGAVYVWAFDWLGNWTGAASWNLGIDRTPPSVIPDAYPSYGDAPFRDFWVNWWNSYDNQSGIASYDVQYQDGAAGTWTDLAISTTQVYTLFVGQDDHTYYFRARARDYAGNLSAYSTDEVSHIVDICETTADDYESDGVISSASWITPDGYSQIHNIHTEEDTDWVKFEAQAGITYTLTTGNTGDHADTVLELYDTDGSTLLAENDDCPGRWPASCLDWQVPGDGTYYVKIYHWDEYAYGCTTEYGLSIISNREPSLALGEPGTSFRYTETMGVTEQAYVPDTQHLNAPNGLFIDTSDNLYVVEELGARLLKYRTSDGASLLSVGTSGLQNRGQYTFDHPQDAALDSDGNIWTVDRHRVAQYDASGNFLQEFPPDDPWNAGDDNAHFDTPGGIAFDSNGYMYVADSNNHRIQVYTFDVDGTPVYSTTIGVADEPGDDNVHFDRPAQIVFDSSDRLYVTDSNNYRVQRCTYAGGWTCSTVHGTGSAGDGSDELDWTYGLGIDASNDHVYVVDSGNGRVKECYDGMFGWTCSIFATGLDWPSDVDVDSAGNVYVGDWLAHTIHKYDSSGSSLGVFLGSEGVPYLTDDNHFNAPHGVAVDSDGNIFLTEYAGYRLIKLNAAGTPQWSVGEGGVYSSDNTHFGGLWDGPAGVAVDSSGNAYVADTDNHRVQKCTSSGSCSTFAGITGEPGSDNDHLEDPFDVAVDADGNVYVADQDNHRVQKCTLASVCTTFAGVTDIADSDNVHFSGPMGVAVDADGYVYVADAWNNRVQKCAPDGSCTTFAGVTGEWGEDFGHFWDPRDVAVDDQGRVYVADIYHQRVQVFDSEGAYLTTIGNAWGSKTGELRHAAGVAVDDQGNLYVADELNARVQKFALGVPDWQQVNINGFGDRSNSAGSITLHTFKDHLYGGLWNSAGGQLWRTSDGSSWTQVSGDGFGDADNISIELGAEFNNNLYAGTWNLTSGCEVYSSNDGLSWAQVAISGFGDSNNAGVGTMVVFSGYLYVSTYNDATGTEIWRTSDGVDWVQVNDDGFGNSNNTTAWKMVVFENALYIGTLNAATGAEIWRTSDGTTWEQVETDGFGDSHNQFPNLAVYDDNLYISFANDSTDSYTGIGTQVWRSADGDSWERVVADGFGDDTNGGSDVLFSFGAYLYAATYNDETGSQLWRTDDGLNWTKAAPDGFGDSNNHSTYGSAVLADSLFLATANDAHGTEVWRSDLQLARAGFTAGITEGVAPMTVVFTNTSTGGYDTCTWDFGDDSTSSDCDDPSHEYADAGAYTVTLMVSGAGGTDTFTRANYINAYEAAKAGFTANITEGIAPLAITFTNTSTGDYETCQWGFGDGGTSDNCDAPSHEYTSGGIYTVTLTVSGLGGTNTRTRTGYVTVYDPVDAGFSADPTSGPSPLLVRFTNLSTGDYETCAWNFGDGDTSNKCNDLSHEYAPEPGTLRFPVDGVYTVTLTVSGLGGASTVTHTRYITTYEAARADFSASPVTGTAPLTVAFTNQSTGAYDTCTWDFGDGGTSNDCDDPNYTYENGGSYTVTLTVSGLGGSNTITHTRCVTSYETVKADFSAVPTSGAVPLTVEFTNLSTGDYDTCTWDFGDGNTSSDCSSSSHKYTTVGDYTVTLAVSGTIGSDAMTRMNYIIAYEATDAKVYLPLVLRRWPPIPHAPTLNPIINNDQDCYYNITWQEIELADNYVLQQATDDSFVNANSIYTGENTAYAIDDQAIGTYYYRVRAINKWGESKWSTIKSAVVAPIEIPVISPIDNSDGDGDYIVEWSSIERADSYNLEESTKSNFSDAEVSYQGSESSYIIKDKSSGIYYYRVSVCDSCDCSDWSTVVQVIVHPRLAHLTYNFDFKNNGPGEITQLDVYIAIPTNRDHQQISNLSFSAPYASLTDRYGQDIAYFKITNLSPGQQANISWEGDIKVVRKDYGIDPALIGDLEQLPPDIVNVYTTNESMYQLESQVIQDAAQAAINGATNAYWMTRNIHDFVANRLSYLNDHRWDNAETVYLQKHGSCTEYTYLFIALCRANGLPARYVGGTVRRSEGTSVDTSFHRWAEVYLPLYGWVPIDVQADDGGEEIRYTHFGMIPDRRFVTTIGGGNSEYLDWNYHDKYQYYYSGSTDTTRERSFTWVSVPAATQGGLETMSYPFLSWSDDITETGTGIPVNVQYE
jgi:PKD repeat protein